jgi:hypothetical protein
VDITIDADVNLLFGIYGLKISTKGRREEEKIGGLNLASKEHLTLLVFLFWYASPSSRLLMRSSSHDRDLLRIYSQLRVEY